MTVIAITPKPAAPILKWAGGKRKLLPQLLPLFPQQYTTYYEPCLGGGAVFFELQPVRAALSDINPEVVNVYRILRDRPDDLIAALEPHTLRHSEAYYYEVREEQPTDSVGRAARFCYLNKTCFNGLYRENRKGKFNVSFGQYKNPSFPKPEDIHQAAIALRGVQIVEADFDYLLTQAEAGSFVYVDPPYHPISETSNFTSYTRYDFKPEDQIRLRDCVVALAERGVQVAVSNSDCEFIRSLYKGFQLHEIQAGRSINCQGKKRGKVGELLISLP